MQTGQIMQTLELKVRECGFYSVCFGNSSCVTAKSGDYPVFSMLVKSLQVHLLKKKKKRS